MDIPVDPSGFRPSALELRKITMPDLAPGEYYLEPGCAPLVEALNTRGFTTIASCEGHRASKDRPYVFFRVPEWGRALIQELGEKDKRVPFKVRVELIEADSPRNPYGTLTGTIRLIDFPQRHPWPEWATRQVLDRRFEILAQQVLSYNLPALPPRLKAGVSAPIPDE